MYRPPDFVVADYVPVHRLPNCQLHRPTGKFTLMLILSGCTATACHVCCSKTTCGRWCKTCMPYVGTLLQCRGRMGVTLPIWMHTRRSICLRGKHQTAHTILLLLVTASLLLKCCSASEPPAQADMHNHALYMPSGRLNAQQNKLIRSSL